MRARVWPPWLAYIYPFYRWKTWDLEALRDWMTCQVHRGEAELVDGCTWGKGWRGVVRVPTPDTEQDSTHILCSRSAGQPGDWTCYRGSVKPWLCLPAPAPKAATCFRCQLTDAFYLPSSSQQGQSLWAWFSSWPRWPQCTSLEELRLAFQPKQIPGK